MDGTMDHTHFVVDISQDWIPGGGLWAFIERSGEVQLLCSFFSCITIVSPTLFRFAVFVLVRYHFSSV